MNTRPIVYALLSALLFGISTPAAKVLLGLSNPAILAGLFYCGAGLGAALFRRGVRTSDRGGQGSRLEQGRPALSARWAMAPALALFVLALRHLGTAWT